MNIINQMAILPTDFLPDSARVDFLHFLVCEKPAVRTKLVHGNAKLHLENWCNYNDFVFRIDSECFTCIARDANIAESVLVLDQSSDPHELQLGMLLGYPKCCSNFIRLIGESNIDDIVKEIIQWDFLGDFKRINPSKYLSGSSLICHIPCSPSCEDSLKLANKALAFISEHRNESCLAPWLTWID